MATTGTASLHKLSDSKLTVSDGGADIRGRKVIDRDGEQVGTIDDLMIDDRESKVRFLRVTTGGFIGIGATMFLIPVDAVTKVTSDAVYIDQTRDHVASGPGYAPELVTDEVYCDNLYKHYHYPPYRGAGYMSPLFLGYPLSTPFVNAPNGTEAS
jgi:sporulation protein YlmC with PRC-barrel domain